MTLLNTTRRVLGLLFLILGISYVVRAVLTLAHLQGITATWVRQSGDPDFPADAGTFLGLIAIGSVAVALLGGATAVRSLKAIRGRQCAWLGLALAAIPLHWFWFLFRIIGAGSGHGESVRHDNLIWFGLVTVGYFTMWLISRRHSGDAAASASG